MRHLASFVLLFLSPVLALATSTTKTTLTAPSSVYLGAYVTLTATVTTTGSIAPTGTVSFLVATTVIGTGTLSDKGVATFTGSSAIAAAGSYGITARYNGDKNNSASTSSVETLAIKIATTTTTLASSSKSIIQDATATLTATITSVGPVIPTGKVTFLVGTEVLAIEPVGSNGTAAYTGKAAVNLGTYGIVAQYSGDTNNSASTSASTSVNIVSATTTTLSLSPTSIQQGQPGVVKATVARTGNTGYATGTVTFNIGPLVVATGSLTDGVAMLSVSTSNAPLGAYGLTASYGGDTLDAASSSNSVTATVTPAVDVLTYRNNVGRTGVQSAETALTPANVSATTFGKQFTFTTDGNTYAQPLYVSNYTMNDGKSHNVLYIANATGTIYAFDADNNNPEAGYLWKMSTVPTGESVIVGNTDYPCDNPGPNAGVIGTPTIDRALGVMYVVGKSKLVSGTTTTIYQRIHAINLATGAEEMNGPTIIAATFPGKSPYDSVNGVETFNPATQNQRAALVEANGSVWISWASYCDKGDYHGWTIGYNVTNLAEQTAVFNNTPNGNAGGIWMSAGGDSADNEGNLFTAAGNGTFDANDKEPDYGDTVQRLAIGGNALTPADWFTPTNEATLESGDLDMGMGSPLLFDDPDSGIAPHLLATADKTGRIYLLNRYDLGGFNTGLDSTNGDLQDFTYGTQIFTSFGFFNGMLYAGAGAEGAGAFPFTHGTSTTAGYLATTPSMTTPVTFEAKYGKGGMQPMISANGTTNGILWGEDLTNAVLYAFDAANLGTQLYASSTNATRDVVPTPVTFEVPIIANGHVYVAGQGTVAAYGLLADSDAMKHPSGEKSGKSAH